MQNNVEVPKLSQAEQGKIAEAAINKMDALLQAPQFDLDDFLKPVAQFASTFMIDTNEGKELLEAGGRDSKVWTAMVYKLSDAYETDNPQQAHHYLKFAYHLGLHHEPETLDLMKELEQKFPEESGEAQPITVSPTPPPPFVEPITAPLVEPGYLSSDLSSEKNSSNLARLILYLDLETAKLKGFDENSPQYSHQLAAVAKVANSLDKLTEPNEDESFTTATKTSQLVRPEENRSLSTSLADIEQVASAISQAKPLYEQLFSKASTQLQAAFKTFEETLEKEPGDLQALQNAKNGLEDQIEQEAGVGMHGEGKQLWTGMITTGLAYKAADNAFFSLFGKQPEPSFDDFCQAFRSRTKAAIQADKSRYEIYSRKNKFLADLAEKAGLEIIPGPNGGELREKVPATGDIQPQIVKVAEPVIAAPSPPFRGQKWFNF